MKLNNHKKKIDDFFKNITPKELYTLSIGKYCFKVENKQVKGK